MGKVSGSNPDSSNFFETRHLADEAEERLQNSLQACPELKTKCRSERPVAKLCSFTIYCICEKPGAP
ncbi:hypothetical protein METBIDRAFT_29261 [Metschnikowia bicuspidata var. bicuspidata NRRL YB-4993]|uniref:Uncharacterized protein n=1 Tax=Metschnikowia bicuspidata var. bicuspidata NRRL YB-4993 TaxID=869754 RepID=A0A1A0HF91_9ASCO|nr:hypothetical protein METBIDRAFT_29261 [Metschnikowia bicuspidata var. bicuspidata NRRL YB-4993]OBA22666.1 hypothetical protein METBIDRAFT_29261 [Metschnikowia bicuspidata var. bicuspidata NRRL YB-4993]